MSLADELLADLEEDAVGTLSYDDNMTVDDDLVEEIEIKSPLSTDPSSIYNVAKLSKSQELFDVMEKIDFFQQRGRKSVHGPVEADPEYQLIIEANNLTVEIDNETNVIHKFVRDIYYKRFPELESLVQMPLEYLRTVKELGNHILEKSKNNPVLQEILTPATIMVVSVTASTTQGDELNKEDLGKVNEACDMALGLSANKSMIFEYVESRMTFIAPNLSTIVGASTAAKIIGLAGGLTNLSKMPACNVLILGAQKKTLSGFSSKALLPHTGYVYYSDIVQKTPPELRRKAARLVSTKATLAARVDSCHESLNGEVGDVFLADIQAKLEKLQEPPPVKTVKALPAPIDTARKKRGGRRYRKMKERLGMTDMRKATNRMNFGDIEEDAYQEDLGFSLGALGKSTSGRVRSMPVDSKTKAKISKTLHQKLQKQNTWGGSTTVKKHVAGTASSVAFTPLQGLEIVNPLAAEKVQGETSEKYFSSTAGFKSVNAHKV